MAVWKLLYKSKLLLSKGLSLKEYEKVVFELVFLKNYFE